jgi:hypothetical protein
MQSTMGSRIDGSLPSMKSLSCVSCRFRKVLCDRTTPNCKRCLAGGKQCRYPSRKPRASTRPTRISRLEERLGETLDPHHCIFDTEIEIAQVESQLPAHTTTQKHDNVTPDVTGVDSSPDWEDDGRNESEDLPQDFVSQGQRSILIAPEKSTTPD